MRTQKILFDRVFEYAYHFQIFFILLLLELMGKVVEKIEMNHGL